MENIQKGNESAQKIPLNLSKEWWRSFICQCSASGYISCVIKPITYGESIQGSYASLQPTEKGRSAISLNQSVLLPKIDDSILKAPSSVVQACGENRNRIGKGKHMLPFLKELLMKKENWRNLTAENKEQMHTSHSSNVLYYTPDITTLPHYNESNQHFLWCDIQLSKKVQVRALWILPLVEGENNYAIGWHSVEV